MKLRTFQKGIHPREYKNLSAHRELERIPPPKEVFIPLQQHIGAPCKPTVEKKQALKVGEVIGESTGFVSSRIHASVSGTVKTVDSFPHPLGMPATMVHIVADGEDSWIDLPADDNSWEQMSPDDITAKIQQAGIVGMGGAAFPAHVKLSPPKGKTIDTFILNGCECEPYLTADHRMMLEQSEELILGVRILMRALKVSRGIIGIENNKRDALELLQKQTKTRDNISVVPLKVKYPQGAEKMLIKAVLDREVPAGGLPLDVGVVVNNVGTAIAAAQAVTRNIPLIERVVTVTGDGIRQPKNVIARIGTPFRDLIDFCGGLKDDTTRILMGGPLMGVAQHSMQVPVVKATSGILCLAADASLHKREYACIRCGRCVDSCPMGLLPTRIARLAEIENFDTAEEMGILSCIECGSCAYVCPAQIPMVQHIRIGKLRINERNRQEQVEAT